MDLQGARARLLISCLAAVAWLGTGAARAQATLDLPAVEVGAGADVVVPIELDSAVGVDQLELVFVYDPALVTPTAILTTELSGDFALAFDDKTPGQLLVSLTGGGPIVTTGLEPVASVVFFAQGSAGNVSVLAWASAVVNGGALAATTSDGSISVIAPESVVSAEDDAAAPSGGSVAVDVSSTSFSDVIGIDLTLLFNPDIVTVQNVSPTALTAGATVTFNVPSPGRLIVSLFSFNPLSGSGPLVQVSFLATGANGERTTLDLGRAILNEGAVSTTLDDGLLTICTGNDVDLDGVTDCAGDCNDGNDAIFSGSEEICGDGLDNNCDGFVDNGTAPTEPPTLAATKTGLFTLSWTAVEGASAYDVVRGDLLLLRSGGGSFISSTDSCLAEDVAGTSVTDGDALPAGQARWYLVRASGCGVDGSYDSEGAGQVAGRDSGISAAALACQ